MSAKLSFLVKNPEILKALLGLVGKIGWKTLLTSLIQAKWRSYRNGDEFLRHLLPAIWLAWGEKEAVNDGDRSLTYGEYHRRVIVLANGFHEQGIKPGDSIACLLYNCVEWLEIMGACLVMGYKMPLLNWHLNPDELVSCVNLANAKMLIIDEDFSELVAKGNGEFESVEQLIMIRRNHSRSDSAVQLSQAESFDFLFHSRNKELPPGGFNFPQKTYSGGTTGTPKFIDTNDPDGKKEALFDGKGLDEQEKFELSLSLLKFLYELKLTRIADRETGAVRSLIPGPLYHPGVQLALLPFLFGGTVFPMRKFTAQAFLQKIQENRINFVFVAPTMLQRVLALDEAERVAFDLSSMETVLCGAAPCPAAVKRETNELFRQCGAGQNVFHEAYGSSETAVVSVLLPQDYETHDAAYGSVGIPRTSKCRVFNLEESRWCSANETGQIFIRTPHAFRVSYAGRAADSLRKDFHLIEGKYWYDDGLIGHIDEHGMLFITSRSKEMIISGGVNIFPNEIESVFMAHDFVLDAAVVSAPDKDLGEVPGLVVQTKEGSSITSDELMDYARENGLYGFKLPRHIRFMEKFP